MLTFNHIGIFVSDIATGNKYFEKLINIKKKSNCIIDYKIGVKVQFLYDKEDICYELVAPYKNPNPVNEVILEKKNILNHIAYQSNIFDKDIEKIRNNGNLPLSKPMQAEAFNRSRVIFFLTPLRFIIEVIEGDNL